MSLGIDRPLSDEAWEAAENANNPGSLNTFATLADVLTSGGGNQILSGSAAYSGVGLVYDVTALVYTIQGTLYGSSPTTVTLDPADPTNPRIDVIYVDDTGTVGKITGTPGAVPVKPQVDNLTQVEVTFVTVPAGATTPGITIEDIYDENLGTGGGEWNVSTTAPVIFNDVTDPYSGTVHIATTSAFGPNKNIIFDDAPYAMNGGLLSFRLKAKSNMGVTTGKFLVGFFVGGSLVGNSVTVGGTPTATFGFIGTDIGNWQLVTIPISAFGGLPANIDQLRVFTVGGPNSAEFDMDEVRILEGVATPPAPIQGHEIQDEGVALLQRLALDFQGTGVTVTDDPINGKTIVTIPGGGGGGGWNPTAITLGDFVANGATAALNIGAGYYYSFDATSDDEIIVQIALARNGVAYDASSVRLDLHNMLVGAGGVGDTVLWEVDYAWINDGDNAYTAIDGTITNSVNVNGRASQIKFTDSLTIPAGTAGDDLLQLTIRRNSQGGGADSFGGDVEIYGVDIVKL
jgi:hypothetical protein